MSQRHYYFLFTAIVAFLACVYYYYSVKEERYAPLNSQDTIAVSIASYRDEECSNTVKTLIEKATHPNSLHFYILQQNSAAKDGEDCFPPAFCEKWGHLITNITISNCEASGPSTARELLCRRYLESAPEKYFLQIDSHMLPINEGWDVAVVQEFERIAKAENTRRFVISTYPNSSENIGTGLPVICKATLDKNGVPNFKAIIMKDLKQHKRVYFTAGGFFFATRDVVNTVPLKGYDALFQGEELLTSLRLYAHDIAVFAPSIEVFVHHYGRHQSPKVWKDIPSFMSRQKETLAFLKKVLLLDGEEGGCSQLIKEERRNLGLSERIIRNFYRESGIDKVIHSVFDSRHFGTPYSHRRRVSSSSPSTKKNSAYQLDGRMAAAFNFWTYI